jgi:hypothetical protein
MLRRGAGRAVVDEDVYRVPGHCKIQRAVGRRIARLQLAMRCVSNSPALPAAFW